MTPVSLSGKRVLVVEDEYFIASDLKRLLSDADAVVLGPMASLDAGMAVLDGGAAIDLAVLDINLSGLDSYPIAERLAAQGVPFLFVTGYDSSAMPSAYRAAPRLVKPFSPGAVVHTVARLVADSEEK